MGDAYERLRAGIRLVLRTIREEKLGCGDESCTIYNSAYIYKGERLIIFGVLCEGSGGENHTRVVVARAKGGRDAFNYKM